MMEFWTETRPKAAKAHKCEACGGEISPGNVYASMAGKADGDFFAVKQHEECRKAEIGLAEVHGLYGGEDWIHLNDLGDCDDFLWLEENHPAAFERIKSRYSHWLTCKVVSP